MERTIARLLAQAIRRAESRQQYVCARTGRLWCADERLRMVSELRREIPKFRLLILEENLAVPVRDPTTHLLWLVHDPGLVFSEHSYDCLRVPPGIERI